ncbi:hypothetical protein Shyhy01_48250 [Streptomyces hygroscopicus subsp. hygroscopicus]|nr:hypothetical protein Shyhy01_48250 [Streptomyces hygroscopicus subsp. hygroscopicus]
MVGEGDALDDVEDEFVLLVALDRAEGYVPVDGEPGDAHGCLRPSLRTGVLTPKVNRSGGRAFVRERGAKGFSGAVKRLRGIPVSGVFGGGDMPEPGTCHASDLH